MRLATLSEITMLGTPFFASISLAFAGPGIAGFGEIKIRRSGSNSKIFGKASSISSTPILEPVVTVRTFMSPRSASSSRSSSNMGDAPMLPHLKIPTFTSFNEVT